MDVPTDGSGVERAGASLKLLLREASADATGLSASLDLYGSLDREVDTETAVALGLLRPAGDVAFRACALVASGVSSWTPRLVAGVSATLARSARWSALAEVVADVSRGRSAVSAGPTMKLALGESVTLQLTQSM